MGDNPLTGSVVLPFNAICLDVLAAVLGTKVVTARHTYT